MNSWLAALILIFAISAISATAFGMLFHNDHSQSCPTALLGAGDCSQNAIIGLHHIKEAGRALWGLAVFSLFSLILSFGALSLFGRFGVNINVFLSRYGSLAIPRNASDTIFIRIILFLKWLSRLEKRDPAPRFIGFHRYVFRRCSA